jgi:hypothetical protein
VSVEPARTDGRREVPCERELRACIAVDRGYAPVPLSDALTRVQRENGVDLSRGRARAGFSRGHLIDVVLELPGGRNDASELNAAEQLVSLLLGEARAEDWLGDVSVVAGPRGGPLRMVQSAGDDSKFFPLAELAAAFEAAVAGLYAGLPSEPLWQQGGEQRWVLLEMDVQRADSFPAQSDVALASTFLPEMLKCFLTGAPFASARFSRTGELFAYLKTEERVRDPRRALSARRVLEDALDAALVSERAGRVVGSGMGVVYSYVDFGFHALDRALSVVTTVARRVGLPEKSWIQFCDSPLADTWVPVHAGAPRPPAQR